MNEYLNFDWRDASNPLHCDPTIYVSQDNLESRSYLHKYASGIIDVNDTKEKEEKIVKQILTNTETPLVPGESFYFRGGKFSRFFLDEHDRFLTALKILNGTIVKPVFSQQADLQFYNERKTQIVQESLEWQQFVEERWKDDLKIRKQIVPAHQTAYGKSKWLEKLQKYSNVNGHYEELDTITFSYSENETPIEMKVQSDVANYGQVAKYLAPNLSTKLLLKGKTYNTNKLYNSNLPVSQDKNIDKFLSDKNFEVDVVISMSSLKCLVDFYDGNEPWEMPVMIKEYKTKQGTKPIIFVDSPLPKQHPTEQDFSKTYMKTLLRTNFCNIKAFDYQHEESIEKRNEADNENSERLYNVSYKLWNLAQSCDNIALLKNCKQLKSFKVLVRTRFDGCERSESTGLLPVVLYPKLEFAINYGPQMYTKSEFSKQWASLYFIPLSVMHRARIAYKTNEVVKMERIDLNKLITEVSSKHNFKPYLGLGVIYKTLYELSKYPSGNYLLHHSSSHAQFISLMQETKKMVKTYSLKSYLDNASVRENYVTPWIPIDTTVILPVYEKYSRMPGLFRPKNKSHPMPKKSKQKKPKTPEKAINKS